MPHLINRLRFEVNCPDEEYAFNLRHNFSQTLLLQITDIVDQVCSEYTDEEWLRIEKVEIDLGQFSPQSLNINFATVFRVKIEKELIQKLSAIPFWQRETSQLISKAELLQYFLKNGALPWWAEETEIHLDEISKEIVTAQKGALRHFLLQHQQNKVVWQRIAWQFPAEFHLEIIGLFESLDTVVNSWTEWAKTIINHSLVDSHLPFQKIQEGIRRLVLKQAHVFSQASGDKSVMQTIFEAHLPEIIPGNIADVQGIKKTWHQLMYSDKPADAFLTGIKRKAAQATVLNTFQPEPLFSAKKEIDSAEAITTEKLAVRHSGIVLLAPFIKVFFQKVNLLEGTEWKNKEAMYKAVHLLKFLSTGQQKVPEYTLTLEKLFCGLAIEEPVPLDISLEEEFTTEAAVLLQSVIEHWKVLKNTSVSGLQETFLKRDGLISREESGWLVQIERKTLDVLLDSIPWGYSTIKFPWNNYFIYVEW